MLKGIAASEGIGIGKVLKVSSAPLVTEHRKVKKEKTAEEIDKFKEALNVFIENTGEMAEDLKEAASQKEADILLGHIQMISDPFISSQIEEKIREGISAEEACETVLNTFVELFQSTGDELTMQRAADIQDIKNRIIRILTGTPEIDLSKAPRGTIIITDDLTPSMTVGISNDRIHGIVTEKGGYTSHSAILSRSLEIPAVLGVANILSLIGNGDELIIDGSKGDVITSPSAQEKEVYQAKAEEFKARKEKLTSFIGKPSVTASGELKEVFANIGGTADCVIAKGDDAEGIGLFRTEFLYMERNSAPTEDEQFTAYKKVAETFGDKPVIIRTLDIGGDKDIPYMNMEKEDNPFMGFRAIRYCLSDKKLFKTQLRALLRASAYGNLQIMIPMITTMKEVKDVKTLKALCCRELAREKAVFNPDTKLGVMIETPAASLIADLLAKEVDFFSIGTNDLIGYTMAADRGNSKVAELYTPYNPAVLRSLRHICKCAHEAGIPVGMCGEAAANPALTPCLLAFGLDEFSVSHEKVLETRYNLSLWTKEEAEEITNHVMSMSTIREIRTYLHGIADKRRNL